MSSIRNVTVNVDEIESIIYKLLLNEPGEVSEVIEWLNDLYARATSD